MLLYSSHGISDAQTDCAAMHLVQCSFACKAMTIDHDQSVSRDQSNEGPHFNKAAVKYGKR